MAKRSKDEILDDSLPKNVKTKIKLCINRGKVPVFSSFFLICWVIELMLLTSIINDIVINR